MKRKIIIRGFAISTVHFLLVIGLVFYLFSSGMARFDSGVLPGSMEALLDSVLSTMAEILMQPGMLIYDSMPKRFRHDSVEWTLLVANSLLWGFSVLYLWRRFRSYWKKSSNNQLQATRKPRA